jgi:hypothetical protein
MTCDECLKILTPDQNGLARCCGRMWIIWPQRQTTVKLYKWSVEKKEVVETRQ